MEAFEKSLTDTERTKLASNLLSRVASSEDHFLQESVYKTLIELNCIQDLLNMDANTLEDYLFKGSGLAVDFSVGPSGPLSAEEIAHAEALAKFYVRNKAYAAASGVLEHLAFQVASIVDPPRPTLETRVKYLESAVLQARSCGDAALVERLLTKVHLGHIQIELERIVRNTDGGGEADDEVLASLPRALLSLEVLYNDIARRFSLWKECLELVNVSLFDDVSYVQQLWDLYLTEKWTSSWERHSGESEEQQNMKALSSMCEAASLIGKSFYPNESSLPLAAVITRLEQAAIGQWPKEVSNIDDDASSRLVRQHVLSICQNSYESMMKAYESVMALRSSDPFGSELHKPHLRIRVLCSIKDLIDEALANGLSSVNSPVNQTQRRRLLGILASACDKYAAESRQLPFEAGDSLGADFDSTGLLIEKKLRNPF